jgi:AcrR family transcriptional regulator
MAAAMAERSASGENVTVAHVLARAGVSDLTFVALFSDLEACQLAAFELGIERARERVVPAFEAESRWLDAIKSGLARFLRFLEDEPVLGGLVVFHSLGGGPQLLRRRMEVLALLATVVDRGCAEVPAGKQQPPIVIAEGVVGAVLTIVQSRLPVVARPPQERQPLLALFGSLMSMIVLPYMGATVARRELARPAPRLRSVSERSLPDRDMAWVRDAPVRLTYRTARVLRAIADYPGASNREVAERAGILDQGQVSKLLSRLEDRELIVRMGASRTRGAPNSWHLSARGELVLGTTSTSRSGM